MWGSVMVFIAAHAWAIVYLTFKQLVTACAEIAYGWYTSRFAHLGQNDVPAMLPQRWRWLYAWLDIEIKILPVWSVQKRGQTPRLSAKLLLCLALHVLGPVSITPNLAFFFSYVLLLGLAFLLVFATLALLRLVRRAQRLTLLTALMQACRHLPVLQRIASWCVFAYVAYAAPLFVHAWTTGHGCG